MRFAWIIGTALLLAPLAPPPALAGSTIATERPVRGLVTSVHVEGRVVGVGPMTFFVPEGVLDLDEVEEGIWATVSYRKRGDTLIATSVELDDSAD